MLMGDFVFWHFILILFIVQICFFASHFCFLYNTSSGKFHCAMIDKMLLKTLKRKNPTYISYSLKI